MIIEVEIVNIIYRNEANSYTIARTLSQGKSIVIAGKFFVVAVGQSFLLDGEFSSSKYGERFNFQSYELIYPTSIAGIKKFLGSGLIKGVGEATANMIVDTFGKDTLAIIEFQPTKLEVLPRISHKKAMLISESVIALKDVQNVIMHLSKFDISVNMSLKIYEKFKDKTIQTIQENPYCLVEHVDGIGFATADKIAAKVGILEDSKHRIRAGILYCLAQASDKFGHTYLPYEELSKELAKLLNLEESENIKLFDSVITSLVIEKVVSRFFHNYHNVIMLTKFKYFEKSVADKISMLSITQCNENFDVSNEISHFEKVNKIKFHEEQINAIKTAINNGVSVITGGPGTGKTTIIKCILSILDHQNKKTALLAPTGRASKRMSLTTGKEASTIHRALAMDFATRKFYFDDKNPLPYNAVIVDEFSMVDINLAQSLLKAVTRDCKVIIVGDKDQLPSVGAGNVLADIIESGVVPIVYLTQIFRQEENSLIITNAHKINQGEMPDFDNKSKDFFFESREFLEDIRESVLSLTTQRLPGFIGLKPNQIQVLAPLRNGICGIENLNKQLQEKINPTSAFKTELIVGSNTFRTGDKVMQTSNNYNLDWEKINDDGSFESGQGVYNGDIGFIKEINRNNGETVVQFEDGRECIYPRTEISQLSLAYAITIHKSQGSEFDVVVIPCIAGPALILNKNLIYTAVTRAKKMVVLVGEKKNLKRMINTKFLQKRYTLLKDFLIESHKQAKVLFG